MATSNGNDRWRSVEPERRVKEARQRDSVERRRNSSRLGHLCALPQTAAPGGQRVKYQSSLTSGGEVAKQRGLPCAAADPAPRPTAFALRRWHNRGSSSGKDSL